MGVGVGAEDKKWLVVDMRSFAFGQATAQEASALARPWYGLARPTHSPSRNFQRNVVLSFFELAWGQLSSFAAPATFSMFSIKVFLFVSTKHTLQSILLELAKAGRSGTMLLSAVMAGTHICDCLGR